MLFGNQQRAELDSELSWVKQGHNERKTVCAGSRGKLWEISLGTLRKSQEDLHCHRQRGGQELKQGSMPSCRAWDSSILPLDGGVMGAVFLYLSHNQASSNILPYYS